MLVFSASFVNCCSSYLLFGSTLPPSPLSYVHKFVFTYTVYKGGGYGVLGLRQINTSRKAPLYVNYFRWGHFAFYESYLSTRGRKGDNEEKNVSVILSSPYCFKNIETWYGVFEEKVTLTLIIILLHYKYS